MLIVNDLGNEVINADLVFAFSIRQTSEGQYALLAQGVAQWKSALTVGAKDRCERALGLITQGVKQRQHIVDLLGVLGQRPDITVAQGGLIVPGNGEGRPS
jgi:hypothetical protein